ncbi:MAG: hypothetical protein ABL928_02635 [Sphingorhabdus sp.]
MNGFKHNSSVFQLMARMCSGLIFLCVAMAATPSWADQAQTDKAVASYLTTTVPTIERLKPYIDQTETARATAFAGMDIPTTICDAGATDAIYAREKLAQGSADICRALIAWMQNDEINVCSDLKYAKFNFAKADQANPAILQRHIDAGVQNTVDQFTLAAGCAQKDIAYWGSAVVSVYSELSANITLTGDLVVPASSGVALTAENFSDRITQCHRARNIDRDNKSAVVDAADDGCSAMYWLSQKNMLGACVAVESGLKGLDAAVGVDPLAHHKPAVRTMLINSFSDLSCGPILTAENARKRAEAAQAEHAKAQAERTLAFNDLVARYRNAGAERSRYLDQLSAWGRENELVEGNDDHNIDVSEGYCQIYLNLGRSEINILALSDKLNKLQENTIDSNSLKNEQDLLNHYNTERNEWCQLKIELINAND